MADQKKIKIILQDIRKSYFQMICYWLGFYTPDMQKVVLQRKAACKECPLRDGGWCSRKRQVTFLDYAHKNIFNKKPTKVILGCGCWLFAKVFSKISPCPLKRWKKF